MTPMKRLSFHTKKVNDLLSTLGFNRVDMSFRKEKSWHDMNGLNIKKSINSDHISLYTPRSSIIKEYESHNMTFLNFGFVFDYIMKDVDGNQMKNTDGSLYQKPIGDTSLKFVVSKNFGHSSKTLYSIEMKYEKAKDFYSLLAKRLEILADLHIDGAKTDSNQIDFNAHKIISTSLYEFIKDSYKDSYFDIQSFETVSHQESKSDYIAEKQKLKDKLCEITRCQQQDIKERMAYRDKVLEENDVTRLQRKKSEIEKELKSISEELDNATSSAYTDFMSRYGGESFLNRQASFSKHNSAKYLRIMDKHVYQERDEYTQLVEVIYDQIAAVNEKISSEVL